MSEKRMKRLIRYMYRRVDEEYEKILKERMKVVNARGADGRTHEGRLVQSTGYAMEHFVNVLNSLHDHPEIKQALAKQRE